MVRLRTYGWLVLSLPVILVLTFAISEIHSFDLFWQLQSGKYIWQTKAFLYQDTFSLAGEVFRYEHCWLHDLIVYLVYHLGGYPALSVLKGLLLAAAFTVLLVAARQRQASINSIVLLSFPAFLLNAWAWLVRPQLWTFLFFALFIMILDRHQRKADRWVFLLLPLLVLWANLHAAVILAFPLVAASLAGALIEHFVRRNRLPDGALKKLFWTVLLMIPAACVTPYGGKVFNVLAQAPKFGADTGGFAQQFNVDWQLTTFAEFPAFYVALAVIAILFLCSGRKIRATDVFLLGGLALMGLKLARHTPFLFLGMTALMPYYFDLMLANLKKWLPSSHSVVRGIILVGLIFFTAQTTWSTYLRQGVLQTGLRPGYYPLGAVDFVQEHQLPGNLYNSYDWGGYLMWQLYPDHQVFWDGRQDSVEMYRLGRQVGNGDVGWEKILDDFKINTLLLKPLDIAAGSRYQILDRLLSSDNWRMVFTDQNSMVFVRQGAMPAEWLTRHEQPKANIDRVILSYGTLLVNEYGPNRYRVYWEAFRIFYARGDYQAAWQNLQIFKQRAPEELAQERIVGHYEALLAERLKL